MSFDKISDLTADDEGVYFHFYNISKPKVGAENCLGIDSLLYGFPLIFFFLLGMFGSD